MYLHNAREAETLILNIASLSLEEIRSKKQGKHETDFTLLFVFFGVIKKLGSQVHLPKHMQSWPIIDLQ